MMIALFTIGFFLFIIAVAWLQWWLTEREYLKIAKQFYDNSLFVESTTIGVDEEPEIKE